MWAAGWEKALSDIGPNIIWVGGSPELCSTTPYNQVSYMSLDEISPLTFSIGNTVTSLYICHCLFYYNIPHACSNLSMLLGAYLQFLEPSFTPRLSQ
ncbi:hypothetical protein Scep_028742 [Stephania cephalantha]|uniref:Uncharacterized protein n=1 Tax=Stephania cephalantha TaxID=152367 RepID=A0AAP0ECK7_9MAGN